MTAPTIDTGTTTAPAPTDGGATTAPDAGQAPATDAGTGATAPAGGTGTADTTHTAGPAGPAGPPADGVRTSSRDATTLGGSPSTGGAGDTTTAGGDTAGAEAGRVEDLPTWAQREIRHARQGEQTRRVQANELEQRLNAQGAEFEQYKTRQEQLLEGVAKLFGLTGDGEGDGGEGAAAPDPEKLTADLADWQARYRDKTIQLAVHQAAGPAGAHAARLLDSRDFMAAVAKFDPDAPDFDTKVTEAIKAKAAADPFFKLTGQTPVVAAPSGGTFSGGPAGGRSDPESLSVEDFRKRRRERPRH